MFRGKGLKIALFICLLFFVAYLILVFVKHSHFLTGYDLAIYDQVVWKYSQLKAPITTIHAYTNSSMLEDHIEFTLPLVAIIYRFLPDAKTILFLQILLMVSSGIPVFLLAKRYKLNNLLAYALLVSYLSFYGIQNALWSDFHTTVIGISFLAWFLYFLESQKKWSTFVFFLLAVFTKEDMSYLAFVILLVHFVRTRKKQDLYYMGFCVVYLFLVFFVYFPHFTLGYRFQNRNGLLSDLNLINLFNTSEKRSVFFYSLGWFGFLPLLVPLYLLPFLADLFHYFVFGNDTVTSAQGMFMHYRSSLALLLIWPTILVISKYKKLNSKYFAVYILFFVILFQYQLHLPLSYLTKGWFWTEPASVKNINAVLKYLPKDASVVSQSNISPHLTDRMFIYTLFPDTKTFKKDSPCGKVNCDWFHWKGNPEFMIVDTSRIWDARHFLIDHDKFVEGLENMEKEGIIKIYKQVDTSKIYKVLKKPY